MPCTSLFDRQDEAWRRSVLPPGLPRVSIEAGVTDYWRKYIGLEGAAIGVDSFGESAPAPQVYRHFGVDAEHLAAAVRRVVGR
jgi:transketolase